MKVIHGNKYIFVGVHEGWLRFESNPKLINYEAEILLIKKCRYVVQSGNVCKSNILRADDDRLPAYAI